MGSVWVPIAVTMEGKGKSPGPALEDILQAWPFQAARRQDAGGRFQRERLDTGGHRPHTRGKRKSP